MRRLTAYSKGSYWADSSDFCDSASQGLPYSTICIPKAGFRCAS